MVKTSDKKYARRRTPSVERGTSAPSGESSSLLNALAGFAADERLRSRVGPKGDSSEAPLCHDSVLQGGDGEVL